MTLFERLVAKPAHSFALWLGKVLGDIAKKGGWE
jgi:hypothetical protein